MATAGCTANPESSTTNRLTTSRCTAITSASLAPSRLACSNASAACCCSPHWARRNRVQQRRAVAQPLCWLVAFERVSLDHRLPVAPLECLAAHRYELTILSPS